MFGSPVCPFDPPINICDKFARRVVGNIAKELFSTKYLPCALHFGSRQDEVAKD